MKTTGRVSLLEAHIPVAVGRRESFFPSEKIGCIFKQPSSFSLITSPLMY